MDNDTMNTNADLEDAGGAAKPVDDTTLRVDASDEAPVGAMDAEAEVETARQAEDEDPASKGWVRRELELLQNGHSEETRRRQNP